MSSSAKIAGCVVAMFALTACFPDGLWNVGTGENQMPPGLYSAEGGQDCIWVRYDGGITEADMVGLHLGTKRVIVEIDASDDYFYSESCGTWQALPTTPFTAHPNAIVESDQDHRIGIDMAPGTWRSSGSGTCKWTRLSDWKWNVPSYDNIIDSGETDDPATVVVDASDVGFESSGCGGWYKIG